MPNNTLVLNISRKFRLNVKQARKAVEAGTAAWVELGVSIRDLTMAEAIALRNAQAVALDPIAGVELLGLFYEPSAGAVETHRLERELALQANMFANPRPLTREAHEAFKRANAAAY